MKLRALRGAITVEANEAEAILSATEELVHEVMERNVLRPEDMVSCIFTCTRDLDAEFPAVAVRSLPGWAEVPLLCAREAPVPGSLGRCVRVLIHWNTDRTQGEVRHAFVRGARELRPDWAVRVDGDDADAPPVRIGADPGGGRQP